MLSFLFRDLQVFYSLFKSVKRFMHEVLPFSYVLMLICFYPFLSLLENVYKCDFLRWPGDKRLRGNQIVTVSLVTSSGGSRT